MERGCDALPDLRGLRSGDSLVVRLLVRLLVSLLCVLVGLLMRLAYDAREDIAGIGPGGDGADLNGGTGDHARLWLT